MTDCETRYDESPDPIIQLEEDVLLIKVDRELTAEQQGYAIGRSGLIPLRDFLNGHLPPNLKAITGRLIAPDDTATSEPAVLIVDPRYPILGEDLDGFVSVMLHSVVSVIVVRSVLTTDGLLRMGDRVEEIVRLLSQSGRYVDGEGRAALICGFWYRSSENVGAVRKACERTMDRLHSCFNLTLLRLSEKDLSSEVRQGMALSVETGVTWEDGHGATGIENRLVSRPTCLSDFWHDLAVRVNGIFLSRNLNDSEVEGQFGAYLSWSSYLGEIIRERHERASTEEGQGVGGKPNWP